MRINDDRTRLERLHRAYQRNQQALSRTIVGGEARFDDAAAQLPAIRAAIAASRDTRGDAFEMVVGDRRTTARPEAARLIQEWTAANSRGGIPYGRSEHNLGQLGELGGLPIDAALRKNFSGGAPTLELTIRDVPAQRPVTVDPAPGRAHRNKALG